MRTVSIFHRNQHYSQHPTSPPHLAERCLPPPLHCLRRREAERCAAPRGRHGTGEKMSHRRPMQLCVCIYMCIYIYIYIYICVCVHIYIYIQRYIYIYICTYIHIYAYMYILCHYYMMSIALIKRRNIITWSNGSKYCI